MSIMLWSGRGRADVAADVTSETSPQLVHRLFAASILIKGVDGVLETIGGILLMFVSSKTLNSLVIFSLHMNCPKILMIGLPQRCAMPFTTYPRTPKFS